MQSPPPGPACPSRLSLFCWGHVAHTLLRALASFFTRRTSSQRMLTFSPADNLFERLRDTLDLCVGTDPVTAHVLTLSHNPAAWLANNGWMAVNPAYSQAMRSALCTQVLYFSDGPLALGKRPSSDAAADKRWHDDWHTEHDWYKTPVPWLLDPTGVGWATPRTPLVPIPGLTQLDPVVFRTRLHT